MHPRFDSMFFVPDAKDTSSAEAQRFHGERVEARQRQNSPSNTDAIVENILNDLISGAGPKAGAEKNADTLVEMIAVEAVLDMFGVKRPDDFGHAKTLATALVAMAIGSKAPVPAPAPRTSLKDRLRSNPGKDHPFLGMDGILSAFDAEPPFVKFWQKFNDEREARGEGEARYSEAKAAFLGGATPTGALTFVGKDWDGLRAVPAKPVKHLGGQRPAYHGEYREVTDNGTVWHKVTNELGLPIAYGLPEAALVNAKERRDEKVALTHH